MSPTILNVRGFRVIIYHNDHKPSHVHVKKSGCAARVKLSPVEVIDYNGYKPGELRDIVEIVKEHQSELVDKWDELHPEA